MKAWCGRALLAFAIFTLGYGIGREQGRAQVAVAPTEASTANRVVVYYLHATFRCATCNGIEQLAKETVESRFGDELQAGRVEWRSADFQARADLAKRYQVASSTVVAVKLVNGQETAYRRLDDVWTLYDQPDRFADYVAGAVQTYLRENSP